MLTQKVIKIGTSAAVIIPKKSLKALGVSIGDEVIVAVNNTPDPALLNWTATFIKRYRPALKALARQ